MDTITILIVILNDFQPCCQVSTMLPHKLLLGRHRRPSRHKKFLRTPQRNTYRMIDLKIAINKLDPMRSSTGKSPICRMRLHHTKMKSKRTIWVLRNNLQTDLVFHMLGTANSCFWASPDGRPHSLHKWMQSFHIAFLGCRPRTSL